MRLRAVTDLRVIGVKSSGRSSSRSVSFMP
jgi:hypothetical protein